jgi:hypothetical protein
MVANAAVSAATTLVVKTDASGYIGGAVISTSDMILVFNTTTKAWVYSTISSVAAVSSSTVSLGLGKSHWPVRNRRVTSPIAAATVAITTAGHLVSWRKDGLTLTEIATSLSQPLPQKRRLLSHRIAGERSDRMECRGGASYETCFQLEAVQPEVFWSFQQELVEAGMKRGLLHRFESGGRVALGAVSWIDVETRPRTLIIQAFHTFPDDLAIVKSQSVFETP